MVLKHYIIAFGFLLFTGFPIVNSLVKLLPDIESGENRQLKSFPEFKTIPIESISKNIENYLIDRISIRNRLIKFYNQLYLVVFRSSPIPISALIGKNGWYFLSGEELKSYNGNKSFTAAELSQFKNEMLRRKKIIESHGTKFFIAIVPVKPNIYPEFMPSHLTKGNNGSLGEQVLSYLQKNNIPAIDLFTPLRKEKKLADVYYKTDNHWNDWGAYVASSSILNEFKKYYPKITISKTNISQIKKIPQKAGNIAVMLSIENDIPEFNYVPDAKNNLKNKESKLNKYKCPDGFAYCDEYELTRSTKNDSLPVVLLIRDSFGERLFPYLSEQCSRCTSIYDAWHYGLNEDIIIGEKPNIVLLLVLESNLDNILEFCKK